MSMTMTETRPAETAARLRDDTLAGILDRAADLADRPDRAGRNPADLIDEAATDFGLVTLAMRGGDRHRRASCARIVAAYTEAAVAEVAALLVEDIPTSAREMLADWVRPRPARTRSQTEDLLRRAARHVRVEAL